VEEVVLLGKPVHDDDLLALNDLPYLKKLEIWDCPELTDAAILHLVAGQTDLETFGIGLCPRVTSDALRQFVRLKKLKLFLTNRGRLPQVNTGELQRYFQEHGIEMRQ
jgi:hypothetical protein